MEEGYLVLPFASSVFFLEGLSMVQEYGFAVLSCSFFYSLFIFLGINHPTRNLRLNISRIPLYMIIAPSLLSISITVIDVMLIILDTVGILTWL